jgi:hypothetical protein
MQIAVDATDLRHAELMLDGVKDAIPRVLMRSINRTVDGTVTDAAKEIAQVVNLPQRIIKANLRKQKASIDRVQGAVVSKGRPVPLIHYGARQTRKGVTVLVKKGRPRSLIKQAFISVMRSGHKGVFARRKELSGTGRPLEEARGHPGRWPKKYRLPIRQLYGPRVEDVFGDQIVLQPVLDKAKRRFDQNFSHEVDYLITVGRNA